MISATSGSNTAVGAFINESSVVGQKIKIISGLGVGQEKTIVSSSQPINVEYLTPTAAYTNTATTIGSITDTTKKWVPNQWRGYQVRAYLGTSQQYFVRRILYNNNDTLFFANAEWHAVDPNQAYNHVYDVNAIAVGTATRCVIQSDTITVDSPWNTNLDYSSKFEIEVGSLVSIQNISTNALFLVYRYDPLYANWFPLHVMSGVMPTYLAGTTLSFEPLSAELTPDFITGSLTSGSVRLAQDTTQNWKVNQWTNYRFVNTTNGLSIVSDAVALGGTLSQDTLIQGSNKTLEIIGLSSSGISRIELDGGQTSLQLRPDYDETKLQSNNGTNSSCLRNIHLVNIAAIRL
jgi:hypothetical protein